MFIGKAQTSHGNRYEGLIHNFCAKKYHNIFHNIILTLSFSATQSASKQLESDNKLANTLFGIMALFFCGHILRIVNNINKPFIVENIENVEKHHPVGYGRCMGSSPIWLEVINYDKK